MQQRAFILLIVLFVITGLTALTAVSLNRSVTELRATSVSVAGHQAFYLAEAGLDHPRVDRRGFV